MHQQVSMWYTAVGPISVVNKLQNCHTPTWPVHILILIQKMILYFNSGRCESVEISQFYFYWNMVSNMTPFDDTVLNFN